MVGLLTQRLDAEHQHVLRDMDEEAVDWRDFGDFDARVALRVIKYGGWIKLAELDPRKRNLVLDIDYTILDTDVFNNTSLTPSHWRRPNLHELLTEIAPYYNIIIWSATGNAHLVHKLQEAGVLGHARYKVALLVDYGAMIRIAVRKGGR